MTATKPLARTSDPQTSHDAAEAAKEFTESHKERILRALRSVESAGMPPTAETISTASDLEVVQVDRRLVELQREGKIRIMKLNGVDLEIQGYRVWEEGQETFPAYDPPHPIQPLVWVKGDESQPPVLRYKSNPIVEDLLEFATDHHFGMNEIAKRNGYTNDDRSQFAQLIGYSWAGAASLPYFKQDIAKKAMRAFEALGNDPAKPPPEMMPQSDSD